MGTSTDEVGQETLVEQFDFITAECVSMSGMAEFDVRVTEESLPAEITDDRGTRSWIEHAVENHLEEHLSSGGRSVACEARAAKVEDTTDLWLGGDSDETEYSVWIQFR